jgi:mRNA interferase HigB
MRVISRRTLHEAVKRHAELEKPLDVWYRIAKKAAWRNLGDVKKTYKHADYVDPYTVFNIKGNNYRLVVKIEYRFGIILTHPEYDKGDWKK